MPPSTRFRQAGETAGQFRQRLASSGGPVRPPRQLFGTMLRKFGTLAELRANKKPPIAHVLYLGIWNVGLHRRDFKSLKQCSNGEIQQHIRLAADELKDKDLEDFLDLLYAELNRRLNDA